MNTQPEDDQKRRNPSGYATFGGIKVRTRMIALIGRITRYLISITALTLLLVMLTYFLGLISF